MSRPEDVLIFGIGGAGCRVIRSLLSGGCPFALGAIDTDKEALAPLQEGNRAKCILAGSGWTWREGSGCGGDVIRGEQAVAKERHAITGLMEGKKLVVTVAGLGGGVATGGCRTIASVARALKIPAVFLLVTPFSFESFARRKNAEECIEDLLPIADIVMRIPNDLLFSMLPSETPFEEAFAKSCEELARSAVGICGLLNCENSLNSDYAGFMAMLKGKKCSCGLGVGYAEDSEGLDRCGIAVERMLESPFLGGAGKLENTDAAILTVTGGTDLQIGEIKRTLEMICGLIPKTASVLTGVNVGGMAAGGVQVTAVCIKYDQIPQQTRKETPWAAPAAGPSAGEHPVSAPPAETASGPLEQGVFELQIFSKGAFANIAPTLYKGEDLDIPTFQRREALINKGTTSK